MKKIICLAAALALLLTGCRAEVAPGETTAETTIETEMQTPPQTTETQGPEEEWAVLTPPLDYEIINGLAKTPTHYYAPHDGGIVRAPIDDIANQEKIPLPGSYEGMKLSGAEICGITKDWLFVNVWEAREKERHGPDDYGEYYEYENYENRKVVTFRVAMGSWKAEALLAGIYDYRPLPWYNSASDSLLIPQIVENNTRYEYPSNDVIFEAMLLSTRKRSPVQMDGEQLAIGFWSSWWQNTIDGYAVLVDCQTSEYNDYYVFIKNNQAQRKALEDISFPKHWDDWSMREAPKNKAEEALREEAGIYATAGDYFFYAPPDSSGMKRDLYRIKIDGTERELLRKGSNIIQLCSVGGKLFCQAYHPTEKRGESRRIDIYLLNEEGKVEEVLFKYWDNTEGNSGYGLAPYGNHLMLTYGVIYGPSSFVFLYDPATGATFPAQKDA